MPFWFPSQSDLVIYLTVWWLVSKPVKDWFLQNKKLRFIFPCLVSTHERGSSLPHQDWSTLTLHHSYGLWNCHDNYCWLSSVYSLSLDLLCYQPCDSWRLLNGRTQHSIISGVNLLRLNIFAIPIFYFCKFFVYVKLEIVLAVR